MTRTSALPNLRALSPARSIGVKLFLILVCVICLFVAALGWFASDTARSGLMEELKRNSAQTMTLVGEKLDMKLQAYANLSQELIGNNDFIEPLFQLTNATYDEEQRAVLADRLRSLLDQAALSDASIRDITLFPIEDAIAPISTIREASAVPDARDEAWMKTILAGSGKEVWLPPREGGYFGAAPMSLFGYGKLLGKMNVGSRDYVLVVQIESSAFTALIRDVKLSESGETAVLGTDGSPLFSNGARSFEQLWQQQAGIVESPSGEKLWTAYWQSPVSGWTLAGLAPLKELTAEADHIQTMTYAAVTGCFVVALLVGWLLARHIGTPLRRMESLMAHAADGKLSGRLQIRRRDELGRAAEAYNRMMERLSAMVAETLDTAAKVADSSAKLNEAATRTASAAYDIRGAAEQIAHGAVSLATSAEQGNVRVELIGERIQDASALQQMMLSSAAEAGEACRTGGAAMDALVRRAEEMKLRLQEAGDRFSGMKASAADIRGILDLMYKMSKQIRILSLNASIEATRAGSRGAGFKVIAEEIRQLAERTDASIANVASITEAIDEDVAGTSAAMDEVMPHFGVMLTQIGEVDRMFSDMRLRMDQLGVHSTAVDRSLRELGDQSVSLTKVIAEVATIAEQSTASSEESASQCNAQAAVGEELLEQSRRLQEASDELTLQMNQFYI